MTNIRRNVLSLDRNAGFKGTTVKSWDGYLFPTDLSVSWRPNLREAWMTEMRNPWKILAERYEGNNSPGRPKHRWQDNFY
jgi:hypothetical protein